MNHNIIYGGIVALLLLNGCQFLKSESLTENQGNQQIHVSSLYSEISSLNEQLHSIINQQNSLFTSYQLEYGEFNSDTLTVPLTLELIPKVITDDMTIEVRVGEHYIPLTQEQVHFSTVIEVPIQEISSYDFISLLAVINQNGIRQTEQIESYIEARPSLLFNTSGSFNGSKTWSKHKYQLNGAFELSFEGQVQSVQVMLTHNNQTLYSDTIDHCEGVSFYLNDGNYSIKPGDRFSAWATFTDLNGLTYDYHFFTDEFDENSELITSNEKWENENRLMKISDLSGRVIYDSYTN